MQRQTKRTLSRSASRTYGVMVSFAFASSSKNTGRQLTSTSTCHQSCTSQFPEPAA